jgi:hypothetical protein
MSRFDGLLDRIISAKPLLAGVVIGLIACAWGGHAVGRINLFTNFDRFRMAAEIRTNYQPSTNQLRSLTREMVRPDQIAVVVAGNSILMGMGQGPDNVWTHQLQAELGDRYRVINVALPGACPQEFGTVVAEMLYKAGHHRLIVITNQFHMAVWPIGEPDGRPVFQWFYHDAATRGLLLDDPHRDARLTLPLDQRVDSAKDQSQRDELKRQVAIDYWMNFRDLWNAFEYEYGVTVWCKPLAKTWWQARKHYADTDGLREPATLVFLETIRPQFQQDLEGMVTAMRPIVRRPTGELIPPGDLVGPYQTEETLKAIFPAPIRERLVMVLTHYNPYFIGLLTHDQRITYDALAPAVTAFYARASVQVVEIGRGYGAADYFDQCHLTVAGGNRMAATLAHVVRQKSAQLGYLEETQP